MAKYRILVVDDEKEIVKNLCMALEMKDYETLSAFDGQEALEVARKEKPDLILLDILMPKLNGYQVCRELKNDEATKSIPIVIVTVKSQESDRFWGKETGADDYMTKPIDLPDLFDRIKHFLEKK
jgi:DNA-binding response OmpR family regulator